MERHRLFRLIDTETDNNIGSFASVQECHGRIRRHGLTSWAIWQGASLIESCSPDCDDDVPSATVLRAAVQTLAVAR